VLDPAGFVVSPGSGEQGRPAVSWDGEQYVVAWQDARSPTTGPDIRAARVLRDGGVRDPQGLEVVTAGDLQLAPALAPLDTGTLAVWLDRRSSTGSAVYAGRIARDGGLLDGQGFPLPAGAFGNESVAVSGSDAGALVVWSRFIGWTVTEAARVSPVGVVLDDGGIRLGQPSDIGAPASVTFDGRRYLVAWNSTPSGFGSTPGLVAERIGTDGVRLDPLGLPLQGPTQAGSEPAISCAGPACLGTWVGLTDAGRASRLLFRLIDLQEGVVAVPLALSTNEDTPVGLRLLATQPGGGPVDGGVSFTFTSTTNGTLTGSAPNLVYTPRTDFFGTDTFLYVVSDGAASSRTAEVRITVVPVNDPPVLQTMSVQTDEDTPLSFTPLATDVEGDPLSFRVVSGPLRGSLLATDGGLRFTPAPDAFGIERALIEVRDGVSSSGPRAFDLFVAALNDAPVAVGQRLRVAEGGSGVVTLQAVDVDGDDLTFQVVSAPRYGTLTGSPPGLRYQAQVGFQGIDRLEFTARDREATSAVATVEFEVGSSVVDGGPSEPAPVDAGANDTGVTGPMTPSPTPTGCGCGSAGAPDLMVGVLGCLSLASRRRRHDRTPRLAGA
jgi:hypothetical protein